MEISKMRRGKLAELRVISKLMELGLNVFYPFVDDQSVDAIIRIEKENETKYYDLQIKSLRSYTRIIGVNKKKIEKLFNENRDNYIIIVYYILKDREEFYYLLPEQALAMMPKDPEWGDIIFKKTEREKYKHQNLEHLAKRLLG